MSEWWSYRPSDFLMFSPTAYWRLVQRYNIDVWPLQLFMIGAGLFVLWLLLVRRTEWRLVPLLLVALWLWVGWAYHWRRYSQINWAAEYFAAAFVLQAALLTGMAVMRGHRNATLATNRWRPVGLALAAAGIVLYPFCSLLAGRPWNQAEVFGLMPEPTALATLGLLMAMGQGGRGWLVVIPALSLLVGLTTAWLLAG